MSYYTQTGDRPDLAALPVNQPEEFIGLSLFPIHPVLDKTGTLYYSTVEADAAAQTGRSAFTAPNNTEIATSTTTWTAAEAIKRAGISESEVKEMGGIEKADVIGAKWAKRQVMRAIESAICTATLGTTASGHFDSAKVLTDAQTALDSIRLYPGKKALFAGTRTLKTIVQAMLGDAQLGPVMARAIAGSSPEIAASGFNFKAWMNALAFIVGVDVVLAGDDNIWNATAVAGMYGFAALPNPEPFAQRYEAQLGRTALFFPDGLDGQPFLLDSIGDRDTKANYYDARAWYNAVTLNSGAMYIFDGATP